MDRGARPSFDRFKFFKFFNLFSYLFISFSLFAQNGVQLAIPGDFAAPFDFLNDITTTGLDLDGDNQIDIIPPCSCRNQPVVANGANPNTGFFDDQIVVATGVSGQEWRIATIINAYHPNNLTPILVGTLIPEVGNTGIYVLPMAHQDAVGYILGVENTIDHPGMLFGPLLNTCYYPDPFIENLADTYCDTEPNVILSGNVTSDFDDNFIPFQPASEFWSITRIEDNTSIISQTFSPSTLGGGHYRVRYTVNAGNMPYTAENNTGCSITVEKIVEVRNSHVMACNSGVNLTLNPNVCQVTITPSIVLANDPEDESLFTIDVLAPGGGSLGNVIPAEYAGLSLLVRIEDFCSGDFCFSTVTVRDFSAPALSIPDDLTIACYEVPDTALTGVATAVDCSPFSITYEDSVVDDECGNPISTVFRNWIATDDFGNTSNAVQVISIARGGQSELFFPPDVEYSCADYLSNPQIVMPSVEGAGIPTLVEEDMCGLIYTSSDEMISLCGDPSRSFVIIRTWIVLDLCGNTLFETDANGNDNMQFIRVEDDTPPEVSADTITIGAELAPQTTGLEGCSSTGFIPPPIIMDECNDYEVEIFTPLGELIYANGQNGEEGGFIPFPGLELGMHNISYVVTDACNNTTTLVVPLEVIDNLPPIMICDNFLNLVLSPAGMGRIMPSSIDEGSRDDCCIDVFKVKLEEEPDSLFRDFIDFNCDVDTFSVVLGVWDCAGNFNQCFAEISVEDRIPPFVQQGVTDTTISCLDDYQSYLTAEFSAPVFADNCGVTIDFMIEETVDDCGTGTLIRTWTATDNPLNPPATFTQTVTLSMDIDYTAQLPSDSTADCTNAVFTELVLSSMGCEMLATTVFLDTLFPPIDSICYQLVRVHQIINWCEYDGVSDPVLLPRTVNLNGNPQVGVGYQMRSDGNQVFQQTDQGEVVIGSATGFYHYQQLINILDTIPPQFVYTDPDPFCTQDSSSTCAGFVTFSFAISDNCTGNLMVNYLLNDFNQPATMDTYGQLNANGEGSYTISGTYPVGAFAFQLMVTDMCGEMTTVSVPFVVEDCTAPTINCSTDLLFSLGSEGNITIAPEELLVAFEDNCQMGSLSFSMTDPSDNQGTFDCGLTGQQQLTIWATDQSGNQTSCEASFLISDDSLSCLQFWNVGGLARTENEEPVAQTIIRLTGPVSEEDTTNLEGQYAFLVVPEGIGYKITPGKNLDFDNGVSTLDLLLISKHIIGVEPFDSPYKIIAADANRSGHVSTLDVIQFRKLILHIDTELAANTSWRFVPEDYTFENPEDPFPESFPEDIILDSLYQDTTINFIGIKVGDVNGSANPANFEEIEERNPLQPLTFSAEDQNLQDAVFFDLYIEGKYESILGGQFALGWDENALAFIDVVPAQTINSEQFGFSKIGDNQLRLSWFQLEPGENPAFKVTFKAKTNVALKDAIWLDENAMTPEVYLAVDQNIPEVRPMELRFLPKEDNVLAFGLWQNSPNPFSTETKISFSLPQKELVQFEVYDVNGRLVHQITDNYEAGLHQLELDKGTLQAHGLLYYQLKAGQYQATKKMMVLDK